MAFLAEKMTISIPLTQADHDQAHQFSQRQANSAEADRVFRNTLAILATRCYLQMLSIPSSLEKSYSWQPMAQQLGDFSDLYIPETRGRLDCRAIQPGDVTCYIPYQDALPNRIGHVVVQLNETYTVGEILGFVPHASVEQLPISYLRSLDDLIDCLDEPQPTRLKQWMNNTIDSFWQPLNTLPPAAADFLELPIGANSSAQKYQDEQRQKLIQALYTAEKSQNSTITLPENSSMANMLGHLIQLTTNEETRFQAAELLWEIDPEHEQAGICKAADIGLTFSGSTLVLMVAILQRPDNQYSVLCRLYSTSRQRLPKGITLAALDTEQNSFFEVTSRTQDDYIQFKLVADEGDTFFTRVSSPEACITECFIIE